MNTQNAVYTYIYRSYTSIPISFAHSYTTIASKHILDHEREEEIPHGLRREASAKQTLFLVCTQIYLPLFFNLLMLRGGWIKALGLLKGVLW